MLAWRFIRLWLTVILTVSPPRWTVSISLCFSLFVPSFSLIMSISSLFVTLFFSQTLSICFRLLFSFSFHLSLLSHHVLLSSSSCLLSESHLFSFTSLYILLSSFLPPSLLSYLLSVSSLSSHFFLLSHSLPTLRWRGVNMSSTCGLIVLSQQSKTTTLKLLNRLHQMTSASSLLPSFALFFLSPFGLRCLTTMKQCLAGRIKQERETQTERRGRKRERDQKER